LIPERSEAHRCTYRWGSFCGLGLHKLVIPAPHSNGDYKQDPKSGRRTMVVRKLPKLPLVNSKSLERQHLYTPKQPQLENEWKM